MFTYLHCYMPQTWEAQIKAGLINRHSGIRFPQSIGLDEAMKFNRLARVGGAFYHLVREWNCPMYIDRLQGGCYIENYPYDMELIRAYRELLGERFWGFQMHEWVNNFRGDLKKLKTNNCPEWSEQAILNTILRAFPFPHPFLESMTAGELADIGCPEDPEAFLKDAEALFQKRQSYTGGDVLPCDSSDLAYRLELRNGAKRLMPEIGAQTADTRIQIAYARGMAKSYGIPFGAYYEPWSAVKPHTACCYHREGKNEWNISPEDFPYQASGENGGSSRSMQRRLQLYAYMAGASFLSEEWGMCNTFYDWNDFELSPYGAVKLEFIRFTERYPDIGSLVTPGAVVLPKDLPVLEGVQRTDSVYLGYPLSGSRAERIRRIRADLRTLFSNTSPMLGTEGNALRNCAVPDALDIVHEDCFCADNYRFLVDLTGSGALANRYPHKTVPVGETASLLNSFLPCRITGNVHKMVSRTKQGCFYLMLLNNSGVHRTAQDGEKLLHEADETVAVSCPENRVLSMLEGNSRLCETGNGSYVIGIPAGGWFFGRLSA